jgi:hypothetical protein
LMGFLCCPSASKIHPPGTCRALACLLALCLMTICQISSSP